MAITSGFFNSVDGDRKYTPEDFGHFLHGLISSGVYAESSSSLQVLATDGMTVEVQPGRAMLDFHWLNNDGPLLLPLAKGGSQDRIDAIVAYVDMGARVCDIKVKQGTPAAAPKAPTMERSDVLKEYMLAKVYVTKLSTSITQTAITDTRADTTVCGWVTGLIKQVDTSTLFKQWQTAYEEAYEELGDYLAAQTAAWEAFFASVTEDNVLPAPALADAGKVPAVNNAGNGYELFDMKTYVNAQAAANLLDNSNFKNPVHQRGGSNYAGAGYFIDRWKVAYTGLEITVEDGYLILYNTTTSLRGFSQIIEPSKTPPAGTPLTVVYKLLGDNEGIVVGSCKMPASGYADTAKENNTAAFARITAADAQGCGMCGIVLPAGAELVIEWVALYVGEYTAETLPEYRPKGYAAELAECMRYYQKFGRVQVCASAVSSKSILITPPCKTKMRAYPTLSATAFVHMRGGGKNITEFPTFTAAAFGVDAGNPNYTLNFDSDLGADQFYVSMLYMQGELDAEL